MENPLANAANYEVFVYSIQHRYPQIKISTLVLKRTGKLFGELAGQLFFENEIRLFIRERLDFKNAVIKGYGYEVWKGTQKLYWYDSQEHPNDLELASTHPHHKHIHPDIKHHRIPAPELRFNVPNLPFLIQEIIDSFLSQ
ncbi:MAG: toxin-antitoxin system TumE family protein [bacterium]